MTTLRQALTQTKHSVPCKIKARNTTGRDWPTLKDKKQLNLKVRAWDEFTIENLNASYGHILDLPIPFGTLAVPLPSTALRIVEIEKPEHVNHLIQWSDGVLVPTLEFARSKLGLKNGTKLKHEVASMKKEKAGVRIGKNTGKFKADHLVGLDCPKLPTLLVGLGRPSHSFLGAKTV